ncbi:MAG: FliI/YscN family ATPase [Deltaproteobacteria bacterium]|nr:MAG: FliI/YscN family ATPase [Deltaproteobacteria bacterium]
MQPLAPPAVDGHVTQVMGMLVEGTAHGAAVGDLYHIVGRSRSLRAEVVALRGSVGLRGSRALLLPFGHLAGLEVGARLVRTGNGAQLKVGPQLLGRIVDAFGAPLDGGAVPQTSELWPLHHPPLNLLERRPINERMPLGVRALDAFVPLGMGQRMGIFAGPGVGKSTLLGMLARGTSADVVILALVGERGREVGHFVDEVLGKQGLQRAVVVAATSDRPASERVRAAFAATAMAEYFRAQGKRVLLFVDSLTRLCMAQREIGLAVGEPPTTKGYPPSSFSMLPQLLERVAPAAHGGAITGLYTVLVEGDDLTDPVADAARALLDGHIVLSRSLALRGQFPAIDVLESLSRLDGELHSREHLLAARLLRNQLALVEDARELIAVGAYRKGADPALDLALQCTPNIQQFLRQERDAVAPTGETLAVLADAQLVKA